MSLLEPKLEDAVAGVVSRLKDTPGALLPILHGIQDALGYVPPAAVPIIADGLKLSRAEVHGVISFYHYFRDTPPGRHTIRLCRAEACQAMLQRWRSSRPVPTLTRSALPPNQKISLSISHPSTASVSRRKSWRVLTSSPWSPNATTFWLATHRCVATCLRIA